MWEEMGCSKDGEGERAASIGGSRYNASTGSSCPWSVQTGRVLALETICVRWASAIPVCTSRVLVNLPGVWLCSRISVVSCTRSQWATTQGSGGRWQWQWAQQRAEGGSAQAEHRGRRQAAAAGRDDQQQQAARPSSETALSRRDTVVIAMTVTWARRDNAKAHTVRRGLLLTTSSLSRPIVHCMLFATLEHRIVYLSGALAWIGSRGQVSGASATF